MTPANGSDFQNENEYYPVQVDYRVSLKFAINKTYLAYKSNFLSKSQRGS